MCVSDLPRVATRRCSGRESNPRHIDRKSSALTAVLQSRTFTSEISLQSLTTWTGARYRRPSFLSRCVSVAVTSVEMLWHLHPTHWSWWKSEASFCAPRGPMRAIYEDRIWQTQFPRCCTQNMELFTAPSPFANHQPTTVPVWAQNSSLQTRLHMTLPSRTIEEWTYLLTYFVTLLWQCSVPTSYSTVKRRQRAAMSCAVGDIGC